MDIFRASQIIHDLRYQYEYESPTIYSEIIEKNKKDLLVYITVNGEYGAFELHTHNVEVPEKRFDDKELIEMATILHVLTNGKVKIIKNFGKKDFDTFM